MKSRKQTSVGPLAQGAALGAVARLRAIDSVLSPIVGRKGVSALLTRSVHLASVEHPWLAALAADGTLVDPEKFQSVFEAQSNIDAAAGSDVLLQTFSKLLATLIGDSLTDRLLRSVSRPIVSDPKSQETSQ